MAEVNRRLKILMKSSTRKCYRHFADDFLEQTLEARFFNKTLHPWSLCWPCWSDCPVQTTFAGAGCRCRKSCPVLTCWSWLSLFDVHHILKKRKKFAGYIMSLLCIMQARSETCNSGLADDPDDWCHLQHGYWGIVVSSLRWKDPELHGDKRSVGRF